MIRIPCPHCGLRDEIEFTTGGQAHIERPLQPQAIGDAAWAAYLFERINPRGAHAERWCHTYGCGQWFNIVRDTVSHKVLSVYDIDGLQPDHAGDAS